MIDLAKPIQPQLDAIHTDHEALYSAGIQLGEALTKANNDAANHQHKTHESSNALSLANDTVADLRTKLSEALAKLPAATAPKAG